MHSANQSRHAALLLLAALVFLMTVLHVDRLGARIVNPEFVAPESLYVNVAKNGNFVTGLDQENFRVSEDGQPQPFRLEAPETPVSIALLVEHSRSSANYVPDIDATLAGFHLNGRDGNWFALATFAGELEVRSDFTRQISSISAAAHDFRQSRWNEINTYDAVYEMVDRMGHNPGRRILIIFGSGVDNFSEHHLDDLKRKIDAENITIFAVAPPSALRAGYDQWASLSSRMNLLPAGGLLRALANRSGGFAWLPSNVSTSSDVIQGILQSIATQYRLVYNTDAHGSWRFSRVRVEAFRLTGDRREDFKVLVRQGWR